MLSIWIKRVPIYTRYRSDINNEVLEPMVINDLSNLAAFNECLLMPSLHACLDKKLTPPEFSPLLLKF